MAGAAIRLAQDTIVFIVMVLVSVYDLRILTVCEVRNANSTGIWMIIWVCVKYTIEMMMFWFTMMMMMVVFCFSYDGSFQF
ncbi:hypothetical protein ZWY2020_008506 [Hordeum vulgare]|nr:hypothetical protein ZWY2020_008506 [Hordeum vulgare]